MKLPRTFLIESTPPFLTPQTASSSRVMPAAASLTRQSAAQVTGGTCFQHSNCDLGRPRRTAFLDLTLLDCCTRFPSGGYKVNDTCVACNTLTL